MNKIVSGVLIFIGGVAVGAVSAVVAMKRMYDDVEDELYAMKHPELAKKPMNVPEGEGEAENNEPAATKESDVVIEMNRDGLKISKPHTLGTVTRRQEERTDYNKKVNYLGYNTMSDEEAKAAREFPREDNPGKPHIISLEEFSEEMEHYDKATIYFYEDDEVLADENEEMIQDVSGTVGDEALTSFGILSNDDEIVYVRNDKLGIDYEVIRLSKSYSESVLGMMEGADE